jgi:hypothetical protein
MQTQVPNTLLKSPAIRRSGFDRFDWLCVVGMLLSFILMTRLPFSAAKFGDLYFHGEAKTLAHVIQGTESWKELAFARAPGPVAYYAIPYLLLKADSSDAAYWRAAFFWNILWTIVAILLIRRTAALLGGGMAGKIAGLGSVVLPFAAYYGFGIAAETPGYVAAALFLYGWARWQTLSESRIISRASAVALAGLIALIFCRMNTAILLGIALICGLALSRHGSLQRARLRKFAILCFAAGLASVALISTALKQLPMPREVDMQASNFSDVLFFGSFQFRTEPWDWRFWGKATRNGSADYLRCFEVRDELIKESKGSGATLSRLQLNWVLRDALNHPWTRLQMFSIRLLALNVWMVNSTRIGDFGFGRFRGAAVYWTFHVFVNLLALLPVAGGVWFMFVFRKSLLLYWPLWGLWLGLLLFHATVYSEPRYLLPAEPALVIMSAIVVCRRMRDEAEIPIMFPASRTEVIQCRS